MLGERYEHQASPISYLLGQALCCPGMGHPGNKAADMAMLGDIKWPLLKLKGTQPSVYPTLLGVPKATAEPGFVIHPGSPLSCLSGSPSSPLGSRTFLSKVTGFREGVLAGRCVSAWGRKRKSSLHEEEAVSREPEASGGMCGDPGRNTILGQPAGGVHAFCRARPL